MARVSQARIVRFLARGDNGRTMTERGRALEGLICYLFASVPGISVTMRNRLNTFETEEIDVALWNDRDPQGLFFLPHLILVECKNWSAPLSSVEVSWFDVKLRNRGLAFGVLVAANGISGNAEDRTAAHSIIAGALREQRQIVVITRQEIEGIKDSAQIVRLVKEKLCELAVTGTIFP